MPKQFGSQLDLQKIPVLNVVVQQAASPGPSGPISGQLWYDTTNNILKGWVNGAWVQLDNVAGGSTPAGPAGGDLTGTYPNPTLNTGVVTSAKIADGAVAMVDLNADTKDQANGTSSLRKLGFLAAQAMPGNSGLDLISSNTAAIGPVGLNGQKITSLADPTAAQDAATKIYVDNAVQGLDAKQSVLAATTANITLSGTQTVDGVALVAGNRCLVKDQSTGGTNGIYDVQSGAWTRSVDMDSAAETSSAYVWVEQGTANADTGWVQTATIVTLGTTAQVWTQFSGAGAVTAGTGLTKAGTVMSLDTVYTDARYVNTTGDSMSGTLTMGGSFHYKALDSSTNLETRTFGDRYGFYNSTGTLFSALVCDPPNSLTTLLASAGYTLSLSAPKIIVSQNPATPTEVANKAYVDSVIPTGRTGKFAGLMGSLAAGVETLFTHSLGTQDVIASFRDATTNRVIEFEWRCASSTQIGVTADIAYAASAIRATVVG